MPEINDKFKITIPASKFYFSTQCNGDKIVISDLALNQDKASTLTWLVNLPPETLLELEIAQEE